jgi:hypothetical protein
MSALGHKRTSVHVSFMSALPPKADIAQPSHDVRLVPIADSCTAAIQITTIYPIEPLHYVSSAKSQVFSGRIGVQMTYDCNQYPIAEIASAIRTACLLRRSMRFLGHVSQVTPYPFGRRAEDMPIG